MVRLPQVRALYTEPLTGIMVEPFIDWFEDDPITIEAKTLLPHWVRGLGERSELPEALIERAAAVSGKGYVPEE